MLPLPRDFWRENHESGQRVFVVQHSYFHIFQRTNRDFHWRTLMLADWTRCVRIAALVAPDDRVVAVSPSMTRPRSAETFLSSAARCALVTRGGKLKFAGPTKPTYFKMWKSVEWFSDVIRKSILPNFGLLSYFIILFTSKDISFCINYPLY